ncbi:MAG TPA: hypothetical protein VLF91_02275 [Candidatus Saccharimonadales bacterium]|nr:hypothetical protein [Candidatus Saccharimonadales bacterium]
MNTSKLRGVARPSGNQVAGTTALIVAIFLPLVLLATGAWILAIPVGAFSWFAAWRTVQRMHGQRKLTGRWQLPTLIG